MSGQLRGVLAEVQTRADAQVRLTREALDREVREMPDRVDAMVTGACIGRMGEGRVREAARDYDIALAQAAAVRNVLVSIAAAGLLDGGP
jgi:1,4-dihydroxy-2-naphthoyl-CoA synthase